MKKTLISLIAAAFAFSFGVAQAADAGKKDAAPKAEAAKKAEAKNDAKKADKKAEKKKDEKKDGAKK